MTMIERELGKSNSRLAAWTMRGLSAALILFLSTKTFGAVIHVPADQPTVQAGINAATSGDTVVVAPGTYVENIDFGFKSLVVSSHFLFDQDPAYILSTTMDGSSPTHPDTASVVLIAGTQDSTTVLQGFTITHGTGTVWTDPHGAGIYREGGGILIEYSSPIIRYNRIIDNEAVQVRPGVSSAGGGGIRAGDGNPHILNNVISNNRGRYGGGIVLNFASGVIKNNVVAYNTGGEDYGGGGVWKYAGDQAVVENNTIVGNASTTSGGGVLLWSSSMMLRNNVIWGNTAPSGPQINGPATVMYCDVQGGYTGTGNINQTPLLFGDYLYLQASSPAIDVGDPSLVYNDVENPAYVGSARWPALGGLRSDMGAYGGAGGFSFDPGAIYADTTIGWAPLAVNFQGFSRDAADAMTWDFGDGAVDTGTTPAHTYFLGGLYNVSLTVDTGAGTVVINEPDFIAALADTMIAADVVGSRNTTVEVIVYARNATRLNEILLPFEFPGSLNVSYQGFVTTGCRTSYFETQTYANYDLANRRAVIRLATSSLPLGPGSGPIAKLRFSIPFSVSSVDTAVIELDGYATYLPEFSGSRAQYQPRTVAGGISVSCCIGIRGNIDGSIGESIDVSDITYLVDYLFDQGEPPPCMDEANVDGITGPSGSVDIADLTYLVGYFFLSGLPPAGCS